MRTHACVHSAPFPSMVPPFPGLHGDRPRTFARLAVSATHPVAHAAAVAPYCNALGFATCGSVGGSAQLSATGWCLHHKENNNNDDDVCAASFHALFECIEGRHECTRAETTRTGRTRRRDSHARARHTSGSSSEGAAKRGAKSFMARGGGTRVSATDRCERGQRRGAARGDRRSIRLLRDMRDNLPMPARCVFTLHAQQPQCVDMACMRPGFALREGQRTTKIRPSKGLNA